MLLFGQSDEARIKFKRAMLYSNPDWEAFYLDKAISLLEEALKLQPRNKKYAQKLDEVRKTKEKSQLNLSMRVEAIYGSFETDTGETGLFLYGKIEQGTVRSGDNVSVNGKRKVLFVESAKGYGIPGETVGFVIEGLTVDRIKRGDIISRV